MPGLLYGSSTWKMNKGDDEAVNVFIIGAYEGNPQIRSQDHDSTKKLLERAGKKPLSVEVMS